MALPWIRLMLAALFSNPPCLHLHSYLLSKVVGLQMVMNTWGKKERGCAAFQRNLLDQQAAIVPWPK
jgi:hypothetical protein